MNSIVQKMKSALETYLSKAKETMKTIEQMRKELLPEVASQRSETLFSDLNSLRYSCREKIKAAGDEGRASADQWGSLKGSDLTDDAKILQAGLTLSQREFDDLCIRYKNNGSMCRLLKEYAEKQNGTVIPVDPDHDPQKLFSQEVVNSVLLTKNLMTYERKVEQWNSLERSANYILRCIDGSGVAQGIDDPAVIFSVEHFGENVEV